MKDDTLSGLMGEPQFIEALYASFKHDITSVDSSWRYFFEKLEKGEIHSQGEGEAEAQSASLDLSNALGIEFNSIESPQIRAFLKEELKTSNGFPSFTVQEKHNLWALLNHAELFEIFLHTKYVGQKRFSLEGAETLIPMVATIIEKGALAGLNDFVLGMPHRGRLNVLVNILHKSYAQVFHEFEDSFAKGSYEGTGDVKYHKGFSSDIMLHSGHKVHVALAPNASHVESVDPIVEGKVRAKQVLKQDHEKMFAIPILIHGDAALAGQGVVYETMQLQTLAGYSNGGTVHIVINNHIGFTTLPKDYKSMRRCTDIAKAFGVPVFHVDAEDPEMCLYAASLALKVRNQFHIDVFIDLNCYRKYGHNESDEPEFTQPLEYHEIKKKKSIPIIYRDKLLQEGTFKVDEISALERVYKESLQKELEIIQSEPKEMLHAARDTKELFERVATSVDAELLKQVASKFCALPKGFTAHRKILQLIESRLAMVNGPSQKDSIDWAMAENLAFATLLWQGKHVRLSGQDCRRGTFSQRHGMWVDQKTSRSYFPLSHLRESQGLFDIYNSPLSEFAILGFEYGYSLSYLDALVIWEAQYGDFCNEAQVIIDQYIVTAEQKWSKPSRITLFLPHGYEGQGPEHSSGRIERFLQLAGEGNMQIVNPTTPAQFFHLLRRQVLKKSASPLIVFTPKGLLRYEKCKSALDEFTSGHFNEILEESNPFPNAKKIIFCSGRVYYDLVEERTKRNIYDDFAIIRIEQLYPLHEQRVLEILCQYKHAQEFFWVQEEPQNMGAWHYMQPLLQELLKKEVNYIGRRWAAVTAVGSHRMHHLEYEQFMDELFK